MGKRGPKRTPTKILGLRGSWRGKTRQKTEPKPTPGAPPSPSWLSPAARELWPEVVAQFDGVDLLTRMDGTALGALTEAVVEYVQARERLKREGLVKHAAGGQTYAHPVVRMRDRAHERIVKLCREFGLTPSARSDLAIETADANDPAARFLKIGRPKKA